MDQTSQAQDIEHVKQKLITMQRERGYGHVLVKFAGGVMQAVEVSLSLAPPSSKKKDKKNIDIRKLTGIKSAV